MAEAVGETGPDQDWQAAHDALLAECRPHNAPRIYHYTSLVTSLEIMRDKALWLSSSATMNDLAEGRWLTRLVREYEQTRAVQQGPRSPEQSQRLEQLLFFALGGPQGRAYLTCFSSNRDLLSQWRAYADDGAGVALGFNPNDGLMPIVDGPPGTNAAPDADFSTSLAQVRYVHTLHDVVTPELLAALDLGLEGNDQAFFALQIALGAHRWTVKNPAFKEEQEWRIVNLPMLFDGDIGGGNTSMGEAGGIGFRARGPHLASYYVMPFERAALVELVLGPRSEVDAGELDLLLHRSGLAHIDVTTSAATYRR